MTLIPGDSVVAWEPWSWSSTPWTVLASLVGFAASTGGIAAVLASSDGQATTNWPGPSNPISVSVVIAILTSIVNVFLTAAIANAFAVAWWVKALRGAQLKELHFDMDIRQNPFLLFTKWRHFNQFTVAALSAMVITILDGPILQRGSTIVLKTSAPVQLAMWVYVSNSSLPNDYSGFGGDGATTDLLTSAFGQVSRAYSNKNAITIYSQGCVSGSTCNLTIPAPGFDVICTNSTIDYDFYTLGAASINHNSLTVWSLTIDSPADTTVWNVSIGSTINITSLYKPDPTCSGSFVQQKCVLQTSTVEYPVTIENDTAVLQPWQLGQNETISITQFDAISQLVEGSIEGAYMTMLGGIGFVAKTIFESTVTLREAVDTVAPYITIAKGQAGSTYLTSNQQAFGNCSMTWDNPVADVVNTIRELMFRSAVAVSASDFESVAQERISTQTTFTGTYQTNWEFFIIALACMLVQVALTAALVRGWPRLGRQVSLSAFEISKALGSPLFEGSTTNASPDHLLDVIGSKHVRYGELAGRITAEHTPLRHSAVEPIGRVARKPVASSALMIHDPKVSAFKIKEEIASGIRARLGFDRPELVQEPRKGALY